MPFFHSPVLLYLKARVGRCGRTHFPPEAFVRRYGRSDLWTTCARPPIDINPLTATRRYPFLPFGGIYLRPFRPAAFHSGRKRVEGRKRRSWDEAVPPLVPLSAQTSAPVANRRATPSSAAESRPTDRLHELGEADLTFAAQPLGGENRPHLGDGRHDLAVDDNVVVLRPVAHLIGGSRHSRA
jgi:hypothetical protein